MTICELNLSPFIVITLLDIIAVARNVCGRRSHSNKNSRYWRSASCLPSKETRANFCDGKHLWFVMHTKWLAFRRIIMLAFFKTEKGQHHFWNLNNIKLYYFSFNNIFLYYFSFNVLCNYIKILMHGPAWQIWIFIFLVERKSTQRPVPFIRHKKDCTGTHYLLKQDNIQQTENHTQY